MRTGLYPWARLRSASGRLNFLIGLEERHLRAMEEAARRLRLGLILVGSRVSGPRVRQRTLHPVLAKALPLWETRRRGSPTWPGVEGVRIEKTAIKEFGPDDPRTSDLTVVLVDALGRPASALEAAAADLEREFRRFGAAFPIKVFAALDGRSFRCEEEFAAAGAAYLSASLPAGDAEPREAVAAAFRELYATVGLPRPLFIRADLANAALAAALASLTFSAALGFHWVVPATAGAFGLCGRYLARFKAWVARVPCETPLSNAAALAADAALGIAVMALVVNPVGGFGIPLARILKASALHTLSRGSWRLWLDKRMSRRDERGQALGVLLASLLNLVIGLATAFVYAGRPEAALFQAALAAAGLFLVFRR